jgi:hypothetical protein
LDYFDKLANTIWLFGKTNSFGVGKTDMRLTQVDENQKVDKNQPAEDIRPISHLDFKTGIVERFCWAIALKITRFKTAYLESLKEDNYDWLDNFPRGKHSQL